MLADSICLLREGRVVQHATPEEMVRNPANDFVTQFVGDEALFHQFEYLKVGEIVDAPPVTVSEATPAKDVALALERAAARAAVVVDERGRLAGVVTEQEITDGAADSPPSQAKDVVKSDPPYVYDGELVRDCFSRLLEEGSSAGGSPTVRASHDDERSRSNGHSNATVGSLLKSNLVVVVDREKRPVGLSSATGSSCVSSPACPMRAPSPHQALLRRRQSGAVSVARGAAARELHRPPTGSRCSSLTGQHLGIVLLSMLFSTALGVPLGILIAQVRKVGPWILGIFGVFYLIPSLALFALLVPITGLGPQPAIIGLVLYAQLPIVRNTATGLLNLDPALVEAALGMGMTRLQRLMLVELPVAAPAIVAGLRVAAVMSVGVATIAAYVGAGGLGNLILRGMQLLYPEMVIAGAFPAALMAIGVDLLFVALEKLTGRHASKPAGGEGVRRRDRFSRVLLGLSRRGHVAYP